MKFLIKKKKLLIKQGKTVNALGKKVRAHIRNFRLSLSLGQLTVRKVKTVVIIYIRNIRIISFKYCKMKKNFVSDKKKLTNEEEQKSRR